MEKQNKTLEADQFLSLVDFASSALEQKLDPSAGQWGKMERIRGLFLLAVLSLPLGISNSHLLVDSSLQLPCSQSCETQVGII